MTMNVDLAIKMLANGGNSRERGGTLYMETGRCKPWSTSVVAALRRRGYRVDKLLIGVYLAYPKE